MKNWTIFGANWKIFRLRSADILVVLQTHRQIDRITDSQILLYDHFVVQQFRRTYRRFPRSIKKIKNLFTLIPHSYVQKCNVYLLSGRIIRPVSTYPVTGRIAGFWISHKAGYPVFRHLISVWPNIVSIRACALIRFWTETILWADYEEGGDSCSLPRNYLVEWRVTVTQSGSFWGCMS